MNLKEKIKEDLIVAMKKQDELQRSVLRFLLAEINKKEIELGKKEEGLTAEELSQVVLREIKKREESSEQYKKASRNDLFKEEQDEVEVLKNYAPKQMSDSELDLLIDGIIKEMGAKGPAEMGQVMREVMAKVAGAADGNRVSAMVKEKLQA